MNWDFLISLLRDHRGRYSLVSESGELCALGAIGFTSMGDEFLEMVVGNEGVGYDLLKSDPLSQETIRSVAAVIRERYPEFVRENSGDDTHLVFRFNDAKPTREVVAVFEEAAPVKTPA